jgi:hypothetical protein
MIDRVYLWSNGMVMTFDEKGDQMPDYQGRLPAVRDRILADAPDSAEFVIGQWRGSTRKATRQEFATALYQTGKPVPGQQSEKALPNG